MSESTSSKMVRFDVGGVIYKLARSTLDLHPQTMLARLADKMWEQDGQGPNDAHFIDRNGDRFQFVLDYMRDGEVNLPMTVSKSAFLKEMEYYGFGNVEDSSIVAGTLEEAGDVLAAVSNNVQDDIEAVNLSIRKWEKTIGEGKKKVAALKAGHFLFQRSNGKKGQDGRVTVRLTDEQDKETVWEAFGGSISHMDKGYLESCLGKYGLELVSAKGPRTFFSQYDEYIDVVLERSSNKKQKARRNKKRKTRKA